MTSNLINMDVGSQNPRTRPEPPLYSSVVPEGHFHLSTPQCCEESAWQRNTAEAADVRSMELTRSGITLKVDNALHTRCGSDDKHFHVVHREQILSGTYALGEITSCKKVELSVQGYMSITHLVEGSGYAHKCVEQATVTPRTGVWQITMPSVADVVSRTEREVLGGMRLACPESRDLLDESRRQPQQLGPLAPTMEFTAGRVRIRVFYILELKARRGRLRVDKSVRIPLLYHPPLYPIPSRFLTVTRKWMNYVFEEYAHDIATKEELAAELLTPSPFSLIIPTADEQECRGLPHFPFRVHFASSRGPITSDMISDWNMGCYRELKVEMPGTGLRRKELNRLFGQWWLDYSYVSDGSLEETEAGEVLPRGNERMRPVLVEAALDSTVDPTLREAPPVFASIDTHGLTSMPPRLPSQAIWDGNTDRSILLRAKEAVQFKDTSASRVYHTYFQGMFELQRSSYKYHLHPMDTALFSVGYWFEMSCTVNPAAGDTEAPYKMLCRIKLDLFRDMH